MIVKIERMDHDGRGIAYVNGKITFIANTLPDEIVDIDILVSKKKFNIGKVNKIIDENKDRITPICPYFEECGGCDLMQMTYERELNYKCEKVKDILKKYAGIDTNLKIVKSDKRENYRNKITLHYSDNKLGFMKKNSNEIININECKIANNDINKYIKNLLGIKSDFIIRTDTKGEIISNLENNKIIMNINDLKYQIDINSFFQINNNITEKVFNHILNFIDNVDTALDLYSGVGTLTMLISKKAKKVYGIEINEYSYNNAIKNIELNKVNNVEFFCGKVEDRIREIKGEIDLIVTDPPRSGMDNKTINIIKEKKPKKIIYMSCEPITLARDLNLLKAIYEIDNITLFDMFPNTKHVETVCYMIRRDIN